VPAVDCNLLLTGELTGDFLALDARSVDVLYRFNTGGSMGGSPSNFWVDKYGGSPTVVAFKLP
jgi:hypothetical protein